MFRRITRGALAVLGTDLPRNRMLKSASRAEAFHCPERLFLWSHWNAAPYLPGCSDHCRFQDCGYPLCSAKVGRALRSRFVPYVGSTAVPGSSSGCS